MNLSTSVQLPDSSMGFPVPTGSPASPAGAENPKGKPADFSALLSGQDVSPDLSEPVKKPGAEVTAAAAEAAAALLTGWMAAAAPIPPPPPPAAAWDPAAAPAEALPAEAAPGADVRWTVPGERPLAGADLSASFAPLPSLSPTPPRASEVASVPAPPATAVPADPAAPAASAEAEEGAIALAGLPPSPTAAGTPAPADSVRSAKPPGRVPASSPAGREKIAEASEKFVPTEISGGSEIEKRILNTDNDGFADHDIGLGIDSAISGPAMNSPAHSPHATTLPIHGAFFAPADQAAVTVTETISGLNLPSQAQQAVHAVMNAAEHLKSTEQSSVQLKFSVGDASLAVRVELRDGEVRATFRTDSTELRSALAAEWQTISADANRPVRLAEAVFTPATSNHSFNASTSGEGSFQQRDSGHRPSAELPARPASFFTANRPAAEPAAAEARPAPSRSNLNLYTFA